MRTGDAGKRAAELLGGARVAEHRGPQPAVAALGAGPGLGGGAAPAAGRRRSVGPVERQRARAGGAAGRRAAALAGQGRDVARRGVCTSTGPCASASRIAVCTSLRDPAAPAGRARRAGSARRRSRTVTRRAHLARSAAIARGPSRCASRYSRLDGAREAADQRGGALALGAQQQHLAGVRVRRARLGVQVVAVVPDDDQPEVVRPARRPRRGCRRRPGGRPRLTARKSR